MKAFIGTKIIKATSMTRKAYNDYRGWELPEDEKCLAEEDGFLVEYEDSEHQNHPDHSGYISWSPERVFKDAYRDVDGLPFGHAIEAMKKGKLVARKGWNGNGMYLAIQSGSTITKEQARGGVAKALADSGATKISILPHIDMCSAQGECVIGWVASQTDMLSDDWVII